MLPRRIFVLFLLIVCCAAGLAEEPTDVLLLGSVTLRLGMPEKEVLSALAKDFDLREGTHSKDKGTWSARPKGAAMAGQLGFVQFRDGRLITASLNWTSVDQGEGVDFARTLIDALKSMSAAKKPCKVSAAGAKSEKGDQFAAIYCGDKMLTIDVSVDEILGGASISEHLRLRR